MASSPSSSSSSPSSSPSPPYPSAARISDSMCFSQYSASLKCLEKFSPDKSKCQEYFDVYKECKEKEVYDVDKTTTDVGKIKLYYQRQARLERNKQRSLFY